MSDKPTRESKEDTLIPSASAMRNYNEKTLIMIYELKYFLESLHSHLMNENKIMPCGKENFPEQWKTRSRQKNTGAKSMVNNVFNNLDKNVVMTDSA